MLLINPWMIVGGIILLIFVVWAVIDIANGDSTLGDLVSSILDDLVDD